MEELINRLRSVKSRSKGELIHEAADVIEQLIADLKQADRHKVCEFCAHGQKPTVCIDKEDWPIDCCECEADCPCKNCRDNSGFEWRGVQNT